MRYFLLMAGSNYYPEAGTEDWIGCFETYEEAQKQITQIEHKRIITRGIRKGEEEVTDTTFEINGSSYDWCEIEDLRDWINK